MKRFDLFLRNMLKADSPGLETGSVFDNDILKKVHLMNSSHKVYRNGVPNVMSFLIKPQKLVLKMAVVLFFVISGLGVNEYMKNDDSYLAHDSTRVSWQDNDTIVKYIEVSADSLVD